MQDAKHGSNREESAVESECGSETDLFGRDEDSDDEEKKDPDAKRRRTTAFITAHSPVVEREPGKERVRCCVMNRTGVSAPEVSGVNVLIALAGQCMVGGGRVWAGEG